MSCTSYNANTAPSVIFSGTLPTNFCHTDWDTTFQTFVESIGGTLPSTYSTFIVSDTQPGPSDRDKVWLEVDTATCRPVGFKLYLNGTWVQVGARTFYAVDTGGANTITVTSVEPSINWAASGQLFLVKMLTGNDGPTTVSITHNSTAFYASVPVRKFGNQPLAGFELLAGQIAQLLYDGTNFQLLNPRPDTGTTTSASSPGYNLSFEDDINGDFLPDQWALYRGGASFDGDPSPIGGGSLGDGSVLANTGIDGSTSINGVKSFKFRCAAGVGNGGGFIQTTKLIECTESDYVEVGWMAKATAAAVFCKTEILWYNNSTTRNLTDKTIIWSNKSMPSTWKRFGGIVTVPENARYYKVRLFGGFEDGSGTNVAGSVWFDDVVIGKPKLNRTMTFTDTTSSNWTCPSGCYEVRVTAVGGGGGGGGGEGSGAHQGGAGGGGGGMGVGWVTVVPGTSYPMSIGAGGSGGTGATPGSAGAQSTFNTSSVIGGPGSGGAHSSGGIAAGGGGGTANTGQLIVSGEPGISNGTSSPPEIGHGGGSPLGAGGSAGLGSTAVQVGRNGGNYGGGGGGARTSSSTGTIGGNGAQGCVIIEY